METYSSRLAKLPVRFRAPHPIFVLAAIFFLCCPAHAADTDYYSEAPDTLVLSLDSSDSLARAIINGREVLFNVSFYLSNGKVTQIADKSMLGRADGVQELATELYDVALGVNNAFSALSSSNSDILTALDKIYSYLDESVFPSAGRPIVYFNNGGQILRITADSLSTFLDSINNALVLGLYSYGTNTVLTSSGHEASISNFSLASAARTGFVGLARLFFGDDEHIIYGINRFGLDYEGQRGSWSLADIIANGFQGLANLVSGPLDYTIEGLGPDGTDKNGGRGTWSLSEINANGFRGLATLLAGTDGNRTSLIHWVDPSNPSNSMDVEDSNLFDLLARGFSVVQNPLAQLQYVLADDTDVELKKEVEENTNQFKDDFTGDGPGAVKPSDISDVAGMSSGVKDAFSGGGVSAGDVISSFSDDASYGFFSQEVLDALDSVNSVSAASVDDSELEAEEDDFMDAFEADEDGFYSLVDLSPWSIESFLGRD